MVIPIMFFIVISLMELGLVFIDLLTNSFAVREGARVGALAGNDVDADCDIVLSIVAGYGSSDLNDLNEIRIFRADPISGDPIPGEINTWKLTGSDPTKCTTDWQIVETWPSITRKVVVGPTSTLDILGVTIDTDHGWITGLPPWRGTMNIEETAIQRLEPEAFE